ncbi:MAG TPA: dethiobiotin synthase [Candidatus Acidoferrales bacterium]|nr:dethiobiotin synthase [Candidatus Acidoferrales bacterium]
MIGGRFFITGTDTGIGKTVTSALLCAALDAFYWKPIQTGSREGTDRATVMRIAGLARERTIPEAYCFAPPVSPHLAARLAGKRIDLRRIKMPKLPARENLIAEGAGGVLVPVNEKELMKDLMRRLRLPVLLVARNSLGTINHTLLSIAALRGARLQLRGVVMVGALNKENLNAIERYGNAQVIGTIPPLRKLNRAMLVATFRKHFDMRVFAG